MTREDYVREARLEFKQLTGLDLTSDAFDKVLLDALKPPKEGGKGGISKEDLEKALDMKIEDAAWKAFTGLKEADGRIGPAQLNKCVAHFKMISDVTPGLHLSKFFRTPAFTLTSFSQLASTFDILNGQVNDKGENLLLLFIKNYRPEVKQMLAALDERVTKSTTDEDLQAMLLQLTSDKKSAMAFGFAYKMWVKAESEFKEALPGNLDNPLVANYFMNNLFKDYLVNASFTVEDAKAFQDVAEQADAVKKVVEELKADPKTKDDFASVDLARVDTSQPEWKALAAAAESYDSGWAGLGRAFGIGKSKATLLKVLKENLTALNTKYVPLAADVVPPPKDTPPPGSVAKSTK